MSTLGETDRIDKVWIVKSRGKRQAKRDKKMLAMEKNKDGQIDKKNCL